MSDPKDGPAVPHVEVPDAAAAFKKLENFTRKILAVPKREIDDKIANEKVSKPKRRRN